MSSKMCRVSPDPAADELARGMLSESETQKTIISETLQAAESGRITESGRTACGDGSRILGPQSRHPAAISLTMCPWSRGGAWHTHVTPDEVRNPKNSIPDMANVVYGLLDVSIVSGIESSEAIIRAEEPEEAKNVFQDALGVDAQSPDDVVDALMDGRIPDPEDAASRIRSRLSSLFKRVKTGFNELERWASDVEYGMLTMSMYEHDAVAYSNYATKVVDSYGNNMTESFTAAGNGTKELTDKLNVDLANLVVSTAVGTVVGEAVSRVVFND